MQCSQCHQENPPQAKFCLACGVRLTLACSACGTELPAGARFCLACGQPVQAPDTVQSRSTAPAAYTPKHLAEKILTSRSALEGERKQVTVLFCDLTNSTALAERLGPEAMHTLLNHFFALALAEVHRHEGTINSWAMASWPCLAPRWRTKTMLGGPYSPPWEYSRGCARRALMLSH
jgi:hypothetical protein